MIIGALNWGLVGAFHVDLVVDIFRMRFGETSPATSVIYILVGIAGLYQLITWSMRGARTRIDTGADRLRTQ